MEFLPIGLREYLFSFLDLSSLILLGKTSHRLNILVKTLIPSLRTKYYFSRDLNPGLEAVKRNDLDYFLYLEKSGHIFAKCVLPRILLLSRAEFIKTSKILIDSYSQARHCFQILYYTKNREMIDLFFTRYHQSQNQDRYIISIPKEDSENNSYLYEKILEIEYNRPRVIIGNEKAKIFTLRFGDYKFERDDIRFFGNNILETGDPDIIKALFDQVNSYDISYGTYVYSTYNIKFDYFTLKILGNYYPINSLILNSFCVGNEYTIKSLAEQGWIPDENFKNELYVFEFSIDLERVTSLISKYFSKSDAEKIIWKVKASLSE